MNMLQTVGGRVAYETFGDGPRPGHRPGLGRGAAGDASKHREGPARNAGPSVHVVAVPGIGDTAASYRALVPRLVDAGCTVHVMDLRGHGGSDTGFRSYTSEDIGDDVVALLDALDIRDAVLLGNSVGAAAIAHASLRSDRVSRLVMLSGFVDDPPNFSWIRPVLLLLFAWPWGVWAWGKYRKTLFRSPPEDLHHNHAELMANLREPGRLGAVRSMMSASKASVAARLSEVTVPALIAMGAQDPDFPEPAEEARSQAERLGGDNRVVMIEEAGHYPQVERPAETAEAILAFLG